MTKVRRRVLISGLVQGVNFRYYTRAAALETAVSGWVRNNADGRVEAVFEGEQEAVERMLAWCHRGSPHGRVDKVDVFEEPFKGEFTDFDIAYTGGRFW